ncbi:MAG: hypothetical protein PVH61_21200 [Candidatus Aminicenantes bacterium]|jgi:hypothetical protein
MKKICFFILLSVFINGTVFPGLTLIQPKGGETLVMGSVYPIKWSAPNSEGEQQVHIYLGTQLIADHCKKKDGSFNWTVGRLKNGSFVPLGHYSIVLESLDGDAFGGKFAIIAMPPLLIKIRKLAIIPLPDDCPMCFQIDLRKIKSLIKNSKERFHLKLFKDNRLAANLGQFGGGRSLPDFAKIKIPGKRRELTRKSPGFTYQLKLFDSRGKLVESQKVTLVIKSQR